MNNSGIAITLCLMFASFYVEFVHSQTGILNFEAALELQYISTNWVLRVPKSQVIQEFDTCAVAASETARRTVPHILNIRYGPRKRQLLDIYGTDLPSGSPILVFIHGGNWYSESINKSSSAYPVIPLRRAGVKCIVAEYDLAPNVTLEVIIEETRELAIFILELAKNENCWNVWFVGHSAGAHLAATLLEAAWFNHLTPELKVLIRGFVLISGYYDLTPLIYTSINDYIQLDWGRAVRLSPMFKVEGVRSAAPLTVSVVISQQDAPAMHGQTHAFNEVIQRQKSINVVELVVPGLNTDHFSVVFNLQYSSYILTQHILSLIKKNCIV